MTKINKVLLTAVPALAIGLSLASVASASGSWGMMGGMMGGQPEDMAGQFERQAEFLGLSVDEIKDAWAEGKSMADLLEENGINEDDLRAKMKTERTEQMKTHLNEMVDAGVITQAQADKRLAWMEEHEDETGPGMGMFGGHGPRGLRGGQDDE